MGVKSLPTTLVTPPKRKVAFRTALDVIYEDPDVSADLKLSRIGDYLARQADKLRMERLLNPVLEPGHRDKMWRVVQQSEHWLESRQLSTVSKISEKVKDWKEQLLCCSPKYANVNDLTGKEPEGVAGVPGWPAREPQAAESQKDNVKKFSSYCLLQECD